MNGSLGYEPYSEYKPSSIDWLGDVPCHWEVRRLKNIASLLMGQSPSSDDCSDNPIGPPFLQGCAEFGPIHPDPKQYCKEPPKTAPCNSILMSVRAPVGRLNMADRSYGIGRGLCSISPYSEHADVTYTKYVLESSGDALTVVSTGSTYDAVSIGDVASHAFPLPPLSEQNAIVRYLDGAGDRIRRAINAKERLIELLVEQRQSVIHRAVTRAHDPDVRMKDSGVEWLGEVPAHWEVRRLKTLCSMKSGNGITAESIEPSGKYPVYGGNGLRGYTSAYTHDGTFVLIGRQGALCGNIHIARSKFWASEHAVVATLAIPHIVEWFAEILDVMNLNQYSVSAAQPGLSVERVLNIPLPVPPSHEQVRIAHYLDKATAAIDSAIAKAQRQIDLLHEYRTRLIADVVTGKVDVRMQSGE